MRQIQSPPPNLFRSSIPWRGIGSKDWAPRNNLQRVGALFVGVVYVLGALAAMASTLWFRAELTSELRSAAIAIVLSFLLTFIILAAGVAGIVLGVRLLRGALRPLSKYDPLVVEKSRSRKFRSCTMSGRNRKLR